MMTLANAFSGLFCGAVLALAITWCVAIEADRRAGIATPEMTPGKIAKHFTERLSQ